MIDCRQLTDCPSENMMKVRMQTGDASEVMW